MLRDDLIKARIELAERLRLTDVLAYIPEYAQVLKIAVECIDEQIAMENMFYEWDINEEIARKDTYSAQLTYDIVKQFSVLRREPLWEEQ